MTYGLAYDREKNLEFFLFQSMSFDGNRIFSDKRAQCSILDIGTLLLMFLNTDFEDIDECKSFIYHFCFNTLYYEKYPEKEIRYYLARINLGGKEFLKELDDIAHEEQSMFLYKKHTFLKHLGLPYNEDFIRSDDDEDDNYEDSSEKNNEQSNENNNLDSKNMFIGGIDDVRLDFDFIHFLFAGINLYSHNVPYAFRSDDIYSILSLEFREFMAKERHIIRKCQNCGSYFFPSNLKETKYCNEEFEDTGKTCRQIGKELTYKKSLKEDNLLDMYRKRYMSLASSVSHYGTDKAIQRFKKYKEEGAIMKAKYLNKEISAKEFENWISSTKK